MKYESKFFNGLFIAILIFVLILVLAHTAQGASMYYEVRISTEGETTLKSSVRGLYTYIENIGTMDYYALYKYKDGSPVDTNWWSLF